MNTEVNAGLQEIKSFVLERRGEPSGRTPPLIRRCVLAVADRYGGDTSKAFAICVAQAQKRGDLKPGSMRLTSQGKKRQDSKVQDKDHAKKMKKYEKLLKKARKSRSESVELFTYPGEFSRDGGEISDYASRRKESRTVSEQARATAVLRSMLLERSGRGKAMRDFHRLSGGVLRSKGVAVPSHIRETLGELAEAVSDGDLERAAEAGSTLEEAVRELRPSHPEYTHLTRMVRTLQSTLRGVESLASQLEEYTSVS